MIDFMLVKEEQDITKSSFQITALNYACANVKRLSKKKEYFLFK